MKGDFFFNFSTHTDHAENPGGFHDHKCERQTSHIPQRYELFFLNTDKLL